MKKTKKLLSNILLMCMCIGLFTSIPTKTFAVNSLNMTQVKSWLDNEISSKQTRGSGECVDFCNYYLTNCWGNASIGGNAGSWKNKCPEGWTVVNLNGSFDNCRMGDLLVEDYYPYGHVSVYYGKEGGKHYVVDQNNNGRRNTDKGRLWADFSNPMYCFRPPIGSAPAPAKAYKSVNNGDYIIVSALSNSKAIDITSGATWSGANVQLYDKDGTPAQDFRITKSGDYYTIQNINSGCNLDVANGSRNSGTNIWQYTPDGTDAQKWRFVDADGGYVYIESILGTYIDVSGAGTANGTNIQAYSFNGTDAQKWKLISISSKPAAEPSIEFLPWDNGNFTYVRETDASIGQEINVSGGTCTDSGMYLYDANGNFLAKAANGSYYYRIYFKINEELGYTLTSGTVYKYKFYAIVNGQTYWSNEYSFKTGGTAPTPVMTDTENPVISNVKITDVTKDGYTVSCTATDNVGVTKVEFPTWTLNAASDGSDQDDLIWHLGVQSGNTYSYRVKTSEHNNETNIEYRTHIYAWDAAGNKSSVAAEDVYIGVKSELTDEQPKEQVKPTETIEPIETVEPKETEKPTVDTKKYTFRFPRTNVYHQDQFDDVKANQWFSQNVADAFEMGLVKGVSNTEFNPYGDVTVAEAVTMAARIHSIYTTGNENFTSNGGMWYQVYLDYAYENGVISRAYYNSDVSQKATRAQFAEIFANAMDDKGFYEINTVKDNAIPDVKMTALYADDVYKLYRAGILAGNDVLGTFSPDTYITRAEVSAILSRMADTSNRLTFTMK